MPNPAAEGWLAGRPGEEEAYVVGGYKMWARNLTPDPETGLGHFTERQIFNALRYGVRPSATPDVEITSAVPGQGNHPVTPHYLSPAMPWLHWRTMADEDLWAIAAYLKHGLEPVSHRVPDGEGPQDFWASEFAVEKIGTHVLPPFPTAQEELDAPARREQVLRGRSLVASHGCGVCHAGRNPAAEGWLAGLRGEKQAADPACNYCQEFQIGPFRTLPRNLTPDNGTGLGRFSELQIFNALRYGLRPGETPDVEITSATPGHGNHPVSPKYLAPPMPWISWRHLSDEDLWAIAAYLKHGLKPVSNRVEDSEGPPDFWLSEYTVEKYGSYPAPPFPTANEVAQE
jgi:mono/diheme cytochrome c family protein